MLTRDQADAQALGHHAADQAGENAADWMDRALNAARAVAARQATFTTDDVWALVGPPPEPRAMGAVMKRLAAEDGAHATGGYVVSARAECHGRPVRVWRSVLFAQRERYCLLCGENLQGKRPEAKFCGDAHKAQWHREHPDPAHGQA